MMKLLCAIAILEANIACYHRGDKLMKNSATLDFRYAQESIDDESASDSKDIFDCLVHGNKPFPHVGISPLIRWMPLQIEQEIATNKPIEMMTLMNFFSDESIHCRWVVLETDIAAGEMVVGTARVILGTKEGNRIGIVDTLYAACYPDLTETMRVEIIRVLLHKIEVIGSNLGLFSMNLLVPVACQDLDSKTATVGFIEQCGYFEAGGHRVEGIYENGTTSHMILQFSKGLKQSQYLHESTSAIEELGSATKDNGEIESAVLTDCASEVIAYEQRENKSVFALMESLIISLHKENINIS